jgi:hypothetical protein
MADRYCGNCGEGLSPDTQLCPKCGGPARETDEPAQISTVDWRAIGRVLGSLAASNHYSRGTSWFEPVCRRIVGAIFPRSRDRWWVELIGSIFTVFVFLVFLILVVTIIALVFD